MLEARITFDGVVVPYDWDSQGIKEISICTFDEGEYPVYLDQQGNKLFKDLRQKVRVNGILKTTELGRKFLQVESYEVLPW